MRAEGSHPPLVEDAESERRSADHHSARSAVLGDLRLENAHLGVAGQRRIGAGTHQGSLAVLQHDRVGGQSEEVLAELIEADIDGAVAAIPVGRVDHLRVEDVQRPAVVAGSEIGARTDAQESSSVAHEGAHAVATGLLQRFGLAGTAAARMNEQIEVAQDTGTYLHARYFRHREAERIGQGRLHVQVARPHSVIDIDGDGYGVRLRGWGDKDQDQNAEQDRERCQSFHGLVSFVVRISSHGVPISSYCNCINPAGPIGDRCPGPGRRPVPAVPAAGSPLPAAGNTVCHWASNIFSVRIRLSATIRQK